MSTAPNIRYVDVTPTVLNADAYDAGDVLFDTTAIGDACARVGKPCVLESVVVLDGDDQTAAAMTLVFLSADVSLGTKDAAVSITDANAANILGYVTLAAADFIDLINSKLGQAHNIGMVVIPAAGTRTVYVAATTAGTPTQTTGGIKLRLGFID